MAYNKINFYKKVAKVQDIVIPLRIHKGLTYKQIYWNFIEPEFHICYRTFQNYMNIPAKAKLRKLNESMSCSIK